MLLISVSSVICLLAGEAVSRIVFNPVDFLRVQPVPHPALNFKIEAGQAGHDENGFRNNGVPETVNILAVGDSMTYGNMATSDQSWPAHLERLTGKTVYNTGIGGYGPLQYLYVMKEQAAELKPESIIATFYTGNDFLDAYNMAYSNDIWKDYRRADNPDVVEPDPVRLSGKGRFLGETRLWLAGNSVVYRIATQNPFFDKARVQEKSQKDIGAVLTEYNDKTVYLSRRSQAFADPTDPRIKEGFKIAQRVVREMKAFCAENDIDFHVGIMPVKEHVYLSALPDILTDDQRLDMAGFKAGLEALHGQFGKFLESENVSYVDFTPDLVEALPDNAIYPMADGHPNGLGYEVAAQAMARTFFNTDDKYSLRGANNVRPHE
jgi:hypothetical protein